MDVATLNNCPLDDVQHTACEERKEHRIRGVIGPVFLEISDIADQNGILLDPRRVTYESRWSTEGFEFDNGYQLALVGVGEGWSTQTFELRTPQGESGASLKVSNRGIECYDTAANFIGNLELSSDKRSAIFIDSSGEKLLEMSYIEGAWEAVWYAKEPMDRAFADAILTAVNCAIVIANREMLNDQSLSDFILAELIGFVKKVAVIYLAVFICGAIVLIH